MSAFDATVQPDDLGSQVLHAIGDLDLATAPTLLARAEELVMATPERLLLDLSEIRFIDSTGVGALIKMRNILLEAGGSLEITRTSPVVDRVLTLVGLSHLFGTGGDQTGPAQPNDR